MEGFKGRVDKSTGVVKGFIKAAGLLYVAKKGFDMITGSVAKATARIDKFEQFDRVMTSVTGSAKEAGRAMEITDGIVTGTAYTLDGAAQSVQNFVTRGLSIDKATKYVEAFGDAVAFYGNGSEEQFTNVTDALSKMVTKGTVEMDQLNRLFDAGIDAVGMYAKATGQSSSDVQDALSKGEISAVDFVDTVSTAMMEGTNGVTKIAGAAKENGATWGAVFANMETAVARGVANIITSIDEMLKNNGLPTMRDMVASFGKKFETVLTGIADGIPKVVAKFQEWYDAAKQKLGPIKDVVNDIKDGFQIAMDIISPIIDSMKASFNDLKANVAPIGADLKILFQSLTPILKLLGSIILAVVVPAFGVMNATLSGLIAAIGPVISAVVNLGSFFAQTFNAIIALLTGDFTGALDYWNQMVDSSIAVFKGLWDGVVAFISTFVETIIGFFRNLWDVLVGHSIIPDTVNSIIEWFTKLFTEGPQIILDMVNAVIGFFGDMATGAISKAGELFTGVKDKFTETKDKAIEKVISMYTAVRDKFTNMKDKAFTTMSNLKTTVSDKWDQAKTATFNKVNEMKTAAVNRFQQIKESVSDKMSKAKQIISDKWDQAKEKTSKKAQEIFEKARDKFDDVKEAARKKFDDVKEAVSTGMGNSLDVVENIKDKFYTAGSNIVGSISKGIKGAAGKVTTAISEVTSKIRGYLPFSPAKYGALRDIMKVKIGESIAKSIDRGKGVALRSMAGLTEGINKQLPDVAGQIGQIHGKSNQRLSYEFANNFDVGKQPIIVNVYDNKEAVRAYVNENNAVDAQIRRF